MHIGLGIECFIYVYVYWECLHVFSMIDHDINHLNWWTQLTAIDMANINQIQCCWCCMAYLKFCVMLEIDVFLMINDWVCCWNWYWLYWCLLQMEWLDALNINSLNHHSLNVGIITFWIQKSMGQCYHTNYVGMCNWKWLEFFWSIKLWVCFACYYTKKQNSFFDVHKILTLYLEKRS
jgi:hypothetical protein